MRSIGRWGLGLGAEDALDVLVGDNLLLEEELGELNKL